MDKAAHPKLQKFGADKAKPDLLVYRPGYMSGNHAIIEVRTPDAQVAGIENDLKRLALFRTDVGYERAIYLIYGYEAEETAKRVPHVNWKSFFHPLSSGCIAHQAGRQRITGSSRRTQAVARAADLNVTKLEASWFPHDWSKKLSPKSHPFDWQF